MALRWIRRIQPDSAPADHRSGQRRRRRIRPWSGAQCAAAAALVVVCTLLFPGCAMHLTPPVEVERPVVVTVADYGYHLSLFLPDGEDGSAEFAYGWWEWFALNRDRWYHAIPLLFVPGRGTLGTRTLDGPPTAENLRRHIFAERFHELHVEQDVAEDLLRDLRAQFDAKRDTEIFNPSTRLKMVHHDDLYWHHHNCNTAVANWLERLDVRVRGWRMGATVRVEGDGRIVNFE